MHNLKKEKSQLDRKFRLQLRLLVTVASKKEEADYFIENLSSGGLFIETQNPLKVGEEFAISFTLPHNRKTYTLNSEVMWNKTKEEANIKPGMGISFKDLPPEEEEDIFFALSQYKELLDD